MAETKRAVALRKANVDRRKTASAAKVATKAERERINAKRVVNLDTHEASTVGEERERLQKADAEKRAKAKRESIKLANETLVSTRLSREQVRELDALAGRLGITRARAARLALLYMLQTAASHKGLRAWTADLQYLA